jgi:hypothetical protein
MTDKKIRRKFSKECKKEAEALEERARCAEQAWHLISVRT